MLSLPGIFEEALIVEKDRRNAARIDAFLLQSLAVLAGAGLGLVVVAGTGGPFGVGETAAGFLVLAVLAAFASVGELNRERLGEGIAIAAAVLGVVMGLVGGVAGLWFFAPILTIAALGAALATARRLLVRDEAHHRPALG